MLAQSKLTALHCLPVLATLVAPPCCSDLCHGATDCMHVPAVTQAYMLQNVHSSDMHRFKKLQELLLKHHPPLQAQRQLHCCQHWQPCL